MTDLFNNEQQSKENDPNQKLEDLLAEIKNDDGQPKYKDVQSALSALKESQDFIPKLLQEKKEVEALAAEREAELAKRQTLQELTDALKSKAQPKDTPATPADAPKGVAEEDIDKLLENKLAAREQASQQKSNLNSVIEAVTSKYGDKAKEHIQKSAEQLNTTPEKLQQLAAENPKLALRLLDTQGSSSTPKPSTSTLNAPRDVDENNPRPTFEKSAARGGMSNKEMVDRWRQVGNYTNKRLGVSDS